MPDNNTRENVSALAVDIRRQHKNGKDPVLSGDFDRFITALARQIAFDLYEEYGDSANVSINELSYWHGTEQRHYHISSDKFEAMCSAHGIPQDIIVDSGVLGRVYFDSVYDSYLMELFGWIATP